MGVYVGTQGIRVLVFDEAANGNAVPIRVISGINTHLESVTDIVLDALSNLYSSQGETHKLVMIAAGAEGNVTPLRDINGNFTQMHFPQSVAVDSSGTCMRSTSPARFPETSPSSGRTRPATCHRSEC
jgi:hypothetical protein